MENVRIVMLRSAESWMCTHENKVCIESGDDMVIDNSKVVLTPNPVTSTETGFSPSSLGGCRAAYDCSDGIDDRI
jgi:hypothetical protein